MWQQKSRTVCLNEFTAIVIVVMYVLCCEVFWDHSSSAVFFHGCTTYNVVLKVAFMGSKHFSSCCESCGLRVVCCALWLYFIVDYCCVICFSLGWFCLLDVAFSHLGFQVFLKLILVVWLQLTVNIIKRDIKVPFFYFGFYIGKNSQQIGCEWSTCILCRVGQ